VGDDVDAAVEKTEASQRWRRILWWIGWGAFIVHPTFLNPSCRDLLVTEGFREVWI
jgi:hypothetical protein